jgi:hypothetical protein
MKDFGIQLEHAKNTIAAMKEAACYEELQDRNEKLNEENEKLLGTVTDLERKVDESRAQGIAEGKRQMMLALGMVRPAMPPLSEEERRAIASILIKELDESKQPAPCAERRVA